ncbi:MAG: UV DNA damage repair endonuclease UvsE [Bacilli bacterium]|nr:UV DNA damage repair endonuclease UvsE [Bacilli bacterium]
MKIRLGYACISKTLSNVTTSSTVTYTTFQKDKDYKKIDTAIKSNLNALKEILTYNIKNNIHFFRLSSKLIPLATKSDVIFDYIDPYKDYYNSIAKIIKDNKLRIDFHPDEFCVLNSTKSEVVKNSIAILEYHYNLLKALEIKNKILVLHIGGNTFGKKNSISRFINNFNTLSKEIQESIAIENDDKIFNISDCVYISKKLNVPVILDYHHHICNHDELDINDYLKDILSSWHNTTPKMHFSSPKNKTKKDFRSHNDYINVDDFINFIDLLKPFNHDVDIMIEAKAKDEALFRLVRELKYKTNYTFIDDTSFEV